MLKKNNRGGGGIKLNNINTVDIKDFKNNERNLTASSQQLKFNQTRNFSVTMLVLNLMMFLVMLVVGMTYGLLSDSKTATGVISIEMPPTISVGSGNLYYDIASSTMYLGDDNASNAMSANTNKSAKVILTDTASSTSAYVKIELSLLGQENILNFDSTSPVVFSDNTAMTSSVQNGVITLTSGAVAEYSYLFLDTIFSKVRLSTEIVNASMQVQITVSLNQDFSNVKTTAIYYNFNSSKLEATVTLPSGEGYIATAITQNAIIGQEYEFTITLNANYNNTPPTVTVNGQILQSTNISGNVYTYKISELLENINIAVTVKEDTTRTVNIIDNEYPEKSKQVEVPVNSYLIFQSSSIYYALGETQPLNLIFDGMEKGWMVSTITLNGEDMVRSKYYLVAEDVELIIVGYVMMP